MSVNSFAFTAPASLPIPMHRKPGKKLPDSELPHIEYVFFADNGDVEEVFTKPLTEFASDMRYGLADDFIGPPPRPAVC
ncbi:hypothetical protein N9M50_06740 [Alphaproteobacteria bacterium]|nr:hypothetical protein [Alphaproteobacteria bacterium]